MAAPEMLRHLWLVKQSGNHEVWMLSLPNFNAAKTLQNADSWAMFCMDCSGEMVPGDYVTVKVAT